MNNLGVGCPTGPAKMDTMTMILLLMVLCPGMLGGCGDNSMLFLILILCMSGGRMY